MYSHQSHIKVWPAACHLSNAYCYCKMIRCYNPVAGKMPQKIYFSWNKNFGKRTFSTPSRQPLNWFSWNLASLLSDSFSQKSCRQFLFSFSVFELSFFQRKYWFAPLTLSWCHKRTNACVKNLRHSFLVEHSLPLILRGTGVEFT